jgi:hypothetical protein
MGSFLVFNNRPMSKCWLAWRKLSKEVNNSSRNRFSLCTCWKDKLLSFYSRGRILAPSARQYSINKLKNILDNHSLVTHSSAFLCMRLFIYLFILSFFNCTENRLLTHKIASALNLVPLTRRKVENFLIFRLAARKWCLLPGWLK